MLGESRGKAAQARAVYYIVFPDRPYRGLLNGVVRLIEQARFAAVRSINVVLTSAYCLVGQRIVEHEQAGSERAAYGQALMKRLAQDLTAEFGRGFSERNLEMMRLFYLGWHATPVSVALVTLRPPAHRRGPGGTKIL
jgi:hypothetical protein